MHNKCIKNKIISMTDIIYQRIFYSCSIYKTYDAVCILCQSLESEEGVVRLDDDIWDFILVGKNGVCLDQLLWKPETNESSQKVTEVRFRLHIDHNLDSCFSYLSTVIRFPQWIGFWHWLYSEQPLTQGCSQKMCGRRLLNLGVFPLILGILLCVFRLL